MPNPTVEDPTAEIVSPQFPCGAAWLANALLELSIPIRDLWGFDTAQEWSRNADGTYTYTASRLPWRQTLASLREGRSFNFREDISPRFSHDWPWQCGISKPVILMVRDPRDALYSEWRRHQRNLGLSSTVPFVAILVERARCSGVLTTASFTVAGLGSG